MAELADAPDLGSGVHDVQVQVLLSALHLLIRIRSRLGEGSDFLSTATDVILSDT